MSDVAHRALEHYKGYITKSRGEIIVKVDSTIINLLKIYVHQFQKVHNTLCRQITKEGITQTSYR